MKKKHVFSIIASLLVISALGFIYAHGDYYNSQYMPYMNSYMEGYGNYGMNYNYMYDMHNQMGDYFNNFNDGNVQPANQAYGNSDDYQGYGCMGYGPTQWMN